MKVSAVVLAAGGNGRFSGETSRLLVEWRGRTLIEQVLDGATNARLAGVVNEVIVVAPAGAARIKSIAVAEGCRVVHPPADAPMSASLKTGVAALGPGAEGMLVLLADQPMVNVGAIRAVVEGAKGSPQAFVRAHYQGFADAVSHPVFIGRNLFWLIHQNDDDTGFGGIAEKHALRWREVWLEGNNPDVDSPLDLDRLR